MRSLCTLLLVASAQLLAACQMVVGEVGGAEKGCVGPLGPPMAAAEIAAMPACCQAEQGAAHCLDTGKVPSEIQPFVATCETGGYCIPDGFLETGASKPPETCTAFGGPGVCLSRCVPQVAENAGLLRRDVCSGVDDLCVPCISPLDNKPTGACQLSELARCVGDEPGTDPNTPPAACDDPSTCNYDANCPPVVDPTSLTACGEDAHCVDAALVADPAQAAQLATCPGSAQLCVPDVFLKTGGKFTPATCTSVAGAEGRCLSRTLPAVKKQDGLLPQDTCAAAERCAPCYDPITGAATGACTQSCDAGPTKPAVTFAQCCSARAHCVPATSVPDNQESRLAQKECMAAELCVPDQILEGQPTPACTAHSFIIGDYTGVCLSTCLNFGIQGVALAQGSCGADYKCAPCTLNGQPTGAPGCTP